MKAYQLYAAISFSLLIPLKSFTQDSIRFDGQLSSWVHFNPSNDLPVWLGGRYLPALNYGINLQHDKLIDFEASANMNGSFGVNPFDSSYVRGAIKPYRLWARYSARQIEIRAGLQKINFGSAAILRPLMWFDQVDPRDPLMFTDGVWGILGRYYLLNNANIWLWGLYGNQYRKGWEAFGSNKFVPEFGGRIQLPVPRGEAGFSYHHRNADCIIMSDTLGNNVPENRYGFDAKFDAVVGFWVEASWSDYSKNIGIYSSQEIINLGADYTFGIGNGLAVTYEQLIAAYDRNPFEFENSLTFSLLHFSYPVGMFDNLSFIAYYDWTNNKSYNFLNWQRQFNKFSMYLMGYINPKEYNIPTQGSDEILFAGSGVQLMFVFNH
ncbi:MAG TPA: hypothetical protein VI583_10955 [Cyclobacteriaceae bacterium]|nr:hypothetical protein [Cyclobacteriaceae bacterium]